MNSSTDHCYLCEHCYKYNKRRSSIICNKTGEYVEEINLKMSCDHFSKIDEVERKIINRSW